jgi:hypothetical protein
MLRVTQIRIFANYFSLSRNVSANVDQESARSLLRRLVNVISLAKRNHERRREVDCSLLWADAKSNDVTVLSGHHLGQEVSSHLE